MNRAISKCKNILKVKLFVNINIFNAVLQVKIFKKNWYTTIKLKKALKSIIQLSYTMSKQC